MHTHYSSSCRLSCSPNTSLSLFLSFSLSLFLSFSLSPSPSLSHRQKAKPGVSFRDKQLPFLSSLLARSLAESWLHAWTLFVSSKSRGEKIPVNLGFVEGGEEEGAMVVRNLVLLLLFVTVCAPIVLYTDRLGSFRSSTSRSEFIEDVQTFTFNGHTAHLNLLPRESSTVLKEPVGIVYTDNESLPDSGGSIETESSSEDLKFLGSRDHKSARVLSTTNEKDGSQRENPIKEVTDQILQGNSADSEKLEVLSTTNDEDGSQRENPIKEVTDQVLQGNLSTDSENLEGKNKKDGGNSDGNSNKETKHEQRSARTKVKVGRRETVNSGLERQNPEISVSDLRVRQLKDQLIRAKLYLSLPATRNNAQFIRELRQRMKEVQKSLGDATKDSELPRNVNERLRTMEETLSKGRQIQEDCGAMVKKLRAMLHSTEEQLRVHKKQTLFLTQLTAKTLPKGLHCLPLRLTTEYYSSLNSSQQNFPNQEKLEDPRLFHYALFSDNILAAAVVINSTVSHARDPSKHVFHIVTDRLNYAAMRMWFLVNPPGKATIQVQNIEEFTWLNSSYSPVLKQLGSPSMIDYYFRAHRANSNGNMKFRNPKYLSILNHLRFYLPEIFPKLKKVLFLDDDIVVQKDLTGLWSLDLKGFVNGAVETCGESFHRFDKYLNFSNPLISKNFDPHACGWAYGMNIFDLVEWKRQNVTEVYHSWQKLNHDRQMWKLGTLPPGLITFYKRTVPINRYWHVLGLGYNPSVQQKDIERAAVIHYNGNLKPWLEIGIPKYRNYWAKYVDYDHVYLRECNISP